VANLPQRANKTGTNFISGKGEVVDVRDQQIKETIQGWHYYHKLSPLPITPYV
jgi:hypothetical protein